MKSTLKLLPLLLLFSILIFSCKPKTNTPNQPEVERTAAEIQSDHLSNKIDSLMAIESKDLGQVAAIIYYSNQLLDIVPLEEQGSLNSSIDALKDEFGILKDEKEYPPIYAETINKGNFLKAKQSSPGAGKRINDTVYYFQPYIDYKYPLIYDRKYFILGINNKHRGHAFPTDSLNTNGDDKTILYIEEKSYKPLIEYSKTTSTSNNYRDTSFIYVESNDTMVFDATYETLQNGNSLYIIFTHTPYHYQPPCKTRPSKASFVNIANRMIKVVGDNENKIKGQQYKLTIPPPNCKTVGESRVNNDTIDVKLARIWFNNRAGNPVTLDTVAYYVK